MAKKIHRFLVESLPEGEKILLSDSTIVHQVYDVLHLDEGEEIILFSDGSDDLVLEIEKITKDSITALTVRTVPKKQLPPVKLIAAISIPKKADTLELIVQKLTEIGISKIVPLVSLRTIKSGVRMERLQEISDEALEQCGGCTRVSISEPLELTACLETYTFPSIVFEPEGVTLARNTDATTLMMYIGPEGGWTEKELALFDAHGAIAHTLGPRVLRTETAAIVGAYTLLW